MNVYIAYYSKVHGFMPLCMSQCMAMRVAVCGSACGSVHLSGSARGSVQQCAVLQQFPAVQQCGSV
jgi:hypothetical protein